MKLTGRNIKLTLSQKVYLIVLASVTCCAVFLGMFTYVMNKSMLQESIGGGLRNIARTAALSVNAAELEAAQAGDTHAQANIQEYLSKVERQNRLPSPVLILKKISKYEAALLATSDAGAPIGAKYRINPTLGYVLQAGRSDFTPIYKDKSGTWISAYAPIADDEGIMAGVLELDYHIGHYIKRLKYNLAEITFLCIIGLFAGILLSIPFFRPILNSINMLGHAASEMEKGNYDYEIRPGPTDEIGHLATAFEKMRRAIKNYTERLKEAWIREKKAHLESVRTLSEAIAVRENYTRGHIERVSRYAVLVARELGLPEEEIETIKYGCILHDIGKIGVDVNIINKSSSLTAEEREKIRQHPQLGAQIIKGVEFLEKARDIIIYHHERYDGKGYPERLKGEAIPISARIVALVDAYDAMSSTRPYREKFNNEDAIDRIKKESGKQFDPKVVEAFLKIKPA